MAVTKLQLYNLALAEVGERSLASTSEDREPRRILDEVWDFGQGIERTCLEEGLFNFATRAVESAASSTVTPAFGFSYAHDLPSDFVRLVEIAADETFADPLTRYEIEQSYIYADVDPLYLRYVSDNSSYGKDLSLWPQSFAHYVGAYMGLLIAPRLKSSVKIEALERRVKTLLKRARSKSASKDPPRFPPAGSWTRARAGSVGGRYDRGKRNQLIG